VEAYTGAPILDVRVQRLITAWNAIFDERDLIVHSISKANGWSADKIRESMTLSRLVIARTAFCLVADLTMLIKERELRRVAESAPEKT
jgi:hypothetical protein